MNKKTIQKLEKELEDIESAVYNPKSEKNLDQKYYLLQQRYELAIRGMVLDIHLAIEDILNTVIKHYLLANNTHIQLKPHQTKSKLRRDIEDLLTGDRAMSFGHKLKLLKSAGLISAGVYDDLVKLNKIRNKCGHYWQLNKTIRKGVKRDKKKKPLLEYDGKNLYSKKVFYAFLGKYGPVYYKLWLKFA